MKSDFFKKLDNDEIIKPITQEKIDLVESRYNLKLPLAYMDFLKVQNGGYINYKILPEFKDKIEIDFLSGIKGSDSDTLEESNYYIEEWELPKKILLLSGQGHWWICLDYRKINKGGEPKISYLDSEYKLDTVIAESFKDFINKLEK